MSRVLKMEVLSRPLTPREHEVLRLMVQGKTNRLIAQNLDMKVGTAKTHIEHIIAKLGAVDRTQAAVRAMELGLLEEQPQ
jgi:DNA-binding CsgD family transcriptional regulator